MRRSVVVMVLGALVAATAAIAQTTGSGGVVGIIKGTVKDETGAALPGATVSISGAATRTATANGEGAFRFEGLPPGNYKLTVQLGGFGTQEKTGLAVVAGTSVEAPFTLIVVLRGEEVVVTGSKVPEKVVDAPATMSLVTSDKIATSPAQNMGDLLRMVPGVNVIQFSARDIQLTARQATGTLSTDTLALLDGRTIYLDFFGLILWDFVPPASEIKQIEVIRGPASAVWGANALTGVINIITKTPRESEGLNLTFTGGVLDRKGGSRESEGNGMAYGASGSFAHALNDKVAFKLSGGYYNSDPLSRPVGSIPVGTHPLDPSIQTGGLTYPADAAGPVGGGSYENRGTSQPKVDLRVDQEVSGGGTLSYSGGYAGTQGLIYSGFGPFELESPSYLAYGKVSFNKSALSIGAFANFLDAKAPNLVTPADTSGNPIQLNFTTQTYDFEIGHSVVLGNNHHLLSYGGNARRNNFTISLAPNAPDRNEFGGYVQDEIFVDKFRLALGGRVDKFGNIDHAVFSPRVTAMFKPAPDHSFRVSFNRAFRSPSAINNFLELSILSPVQLDLTALAPLLPPQFQPLVARPYPLVVKGVGNPNMKEESLNAYELAYTGTVGKRTTVGVALYRNETKDEIRFTEVLPTVENPGGLPGFVAYSVQDPPPGVPAAVMALLQQLPIPPAKKIVPKVVYKYLNLRGLRQQGIEVSVDHAFSKGVSAYANYSYQKDPERQTAGPGEIPYPIDSLNVPPHNRFNAGVNVNMKQYLGSISVNHADRAFWTDLSAFGGAGYSPSYTMLNAAVGVKLAGGQATFMIKGTNLTNDKIQQHVFGDIIKRSVFGELRVSVK